MVEINFYEIASDRLLKLTDYELAKIFGGKWCYCVCDPFSHIEIGWVFAYHVCQTECGKKGFMVSSCKF